MTPAQLRAIIEETARRCVLAESRPDIFRGAFRQQVEFIKDEAKLKALWCTRRSAKSYTAGLYLVHESLENPGCNVLFIALTRASAKGIIWKDVLHEINEQSDLGMVPNQADLTMTLPNGSVIAVTGVDADESEMRKLLGRKYRLVCIDEASMYTVDVRNLVYGVLGPAVVDNGGTICLMGTSSDFPRGLFYDITTGAEPGWKLFQWTAHDNPHVAKNWQKALDDIARDRPLYMQTPQYKQWFLNHWAIDDDKLVYRFGIDRNIGRELPKLPNDGWAYVLGVDLGWEDDNAFVLTAYHVNDPKLYVLNSYARKKMEFDAVAAKIQEYMRGEFPPHKVVIDGANKQGVESMRARSNIPFEYADKQDKVSFIEICNSDLVQGKVVMLPDARQLWEEMAALVWVTDVDKIRLPKKEHPNLPNHRCDAFLYAWRMGYHFHSAPASVKIPKYSKAWYEEQAKDIWEREREMLERGEEKPLWPTEEW